jgi:predicted Zn-dependent protease
MRFLAAVVAALSFTAGAQEREKEIALGAKMAEDAKQRTTAFESAAYVTYIEQIAARLARELPEPRWQYAFSAVEDDPGGPTHEPLSFPGGTIFVTARLILETRNDAEFAGIIAHAMAHCTERHGTRSATRTQLAQQPAIPLIFMGGWYGMGAQQAVLPAGMRRLQRQFEIAADTLAAKTMAAAGFDPRALADYLRRSGAEEDRLDSLALVIQQLPVPPPASAEAAFTAVQEEVRAAFPARRPVPPRLLK